MLRAWAGGRRGRAKLSWASRLVGLLGCWSKRGGTRRVIVGEIGERVIEVVSGFGVK